MIKNSRNKELNSKLKLNPPNENHQSTLESSIINENEPNSNEDVMIKLIRVVANLAINDNAGYLLSNRPDLLEILLKILGM